MRLVFALVLGLPMLGCTLLGASSEAKGRREPFDVSRITLDEEDEREMAVFDEKTREKLVRKRFPGARSLDLVRVLVWPNSPAGPCWTVLRSPKEMPVEGSWTVAGGGRNESSTIADALESGWTGIYRTPAGTGIEQRADFRSLDLTLDTGYTCFCHAGKGVTEGRTVALAVRIRWAGAGKMPEVGVREGAAKTGTGLAASFSTGNVLAYEFPSKTRYPLDRAGTCGATVAVSFLVEPPML
jgi:hypothetical protein